jgi:hypothetical protein
MPNNCSVDVFLLGGCETLKHMPTLALPLVTAIWLRIDCLHVPGLGPAMLSPSARGRDLRQNQPRRVCSAS